MNTLKHLLITVENAYFRSVMGLFLGLFLVLGFILQPLVPKKRRAKGWKGLARVCLLLLFIFCNVRVRTSGMKNIPKKPCVIAMNHRSFLDTLSLITMLDRYFFVITEPFDALPHPLVRAWVENLGYIPVIRDEKDKASYMIGMDPKYVVKECIERVRKGETLIIYPEAHHETHGMLRFKTGAVRIALSTGVPLIPGAFTGTEKVVTPKSRRVHPGTVHIRFGEPLELNEHYGRQEDHAVVERLTRELRSRVSELIP
jgi:1-acyl-sn-glycerol-3-phosphate acyltransferase